MNKTRLKSIGAVFAGFLAGSVLTVAADFSMVSAEFMDPENFKASPDWVVLIVTVYRFVFSVVACYITARLAPANPMKHAIILGSIGMLLSVLGSVFMWEAAVAWYNIAVMLMPLPCAYLGGKLYRSKTT